MEIGVEVKTSEGDWEMREIGVGEIGVEVKTSGSMGSDSIGCLALFQSSLSYLSKKVIGQMRYLLRASARWEYLAI